MGRECMFGWVSIVDTSVKESSKFYNSELYLKDIKQEIAYFFFLFCFFLIFLALAFLISSSKLSASSISSFKLLE